MAEKVHNVDLPYSLTEEERQSRYEQQGGLCAICVERDATDADHNHATGEIRGLLCNRCNTLLGKVRERVTRLRRLAVERPAHARLYLRAAAYLDGFGANRGSFTNFRHNATSADAAADQWLAFFRKESA